MPVAAGAVGHDALVVAHDRAPRPSFDALDRRAARIIFQEVGHRTRPRRRGVRDLREELLQRRVRIDQPLAVPLDLPERDLRRNYIDETRDVDVGELLAPGSRLRRFVAQPRVFIDADRDHFGRVL